MFLKKLMNKKKNYWKVEANAENMVITCRICRAWFAIPHATANIASYHFCPGCGKPMEAPPIYALVAKKCCDKNCEHLFEYDDEFDGGARGYCQACNGKLIGTMNNIRVKECECLLRKEK